MHLDGARAVRQSGVWAGRMSEQNSFIDEVNDELRRDRLFALLRRWGWVAVLAVLLLVGAAAWNEWRKAEARAEAEARGDALLAALAAGDAEALAAVPASGDAEAVALLLAAAVEAEGEGGAADARLSAAAASAALSAVYEDLAVLKRVAAAGDALPAEERRALLATIAGPGAPYRLLAEEQLALLDVEAGDAGAAIARLSAILGDVEVTPGLRQRAAQLIVVLGGEPDAA